jgi:hypothetical protein
MLKLRGEAMKSLKFEVGEEEISIYGLIGGIWMGCSMKSMATEWCMMHIAKWKLDCLLSSEKGSGTRGQLVMRNWLKYRVGYLWWK